MKAEILLRMHPSQLQSLPELEQLKLFAQHLFRFLSMPLSKNAVKLFHRRMKRLSLIHI